MKYFFETYGCQMNTAESAAFKQQLDRRGWTAAGGAEDADLVIINTCSVRETAEQRVMGRLAHYAALKKKAVPRRFSLLVTGCMASRLGETLRDYGADFVLSAKSGSGAFAQIAGAVEQAAELPQNTGDDFFASSYYEEGSFQSFVPVMHGCNNFCSYCIVPYVRGREISRSPQAVLDEIALLASKSVREITLLGQNVNSYYYEEAGTIVRFPDLLELVAGAVQGSPLRRVRFLSSHPKDFSLQTIKVLQDNPVFCRHIHLCAQHGSNRILKAMNRRYTREAYLELVGKLRAALPDLSLSTDILIGFPGETEAEFEEVLSLMDEVQFLYAYMYHYNPRKGTAAFELPGRITEEVKRARLARVIEKQQEQTRELLQSRLGKIEEVLVEGISRKNLKEILCRTERGEMVVTAGDTSLAGQFIQVQLSELRGNTLGAVRLGGFQISDKKGSGFRGQGSGGADFRFRISDFRGGVSGSQ